VLYDKTDLVLLSKFCNGVDLSVPLVQMYEMEITGRNHVLVCPTFLSVNSLIVMKPTDTSTICPQPKILCYSYSKWDFYETSNLRTEHQANLTFKVRCVYTSRVETFSGLVQYKPLSYAVHFSAKWIGGVRWGSISDMTFTKHN